MLTFYLEQFLNEGRIAVDAKAKLNRLLGSTLGMVSYLFEEVRRPSQKETRAKSEGHFVKEQENSDGMLRVTDAAGEEYLCPISKLSDKNFVSEQEKANCVDYSLISEHEAI
jgi:hypothetical protein